MAMVPLEENDWLPTLVSEAPVDALGLSIHLGKKIVIALDVRAAGSANLNKAELAMVARMRIEKSFHGEKALQDSFGVIHTVHSHAEVDRLNAQLFEESFARRAGGRKFRVAGRFVRGSDADGEWAHHGHVRLAVHREVVPLHAALERAVCRFQ